MFIPFFWRVIGLILTPYRDVPYAASIRPACQRHKQSHIQNSARLSPQGLMRGHVHAFTPTPGYRRSALL